MLLEFSLFSPKAYNDKITPIIMSIHSAYSIPGVAMNTFSPLQLHCVVFMYSPQGGWTALMWGAYKGHTDVARMLMDKGANPNITGQVLRRTHHNNSSIGICFPLFQH